MKTNKLSNEIPVLPPKVFLTFQPSEEEANRYVPREDAYFVWLIKVKDTSLMNNNSLEA